MYHFLRVEISPYVLECYTENENEGESISLPEFKVKLDEDATPRYTILSRDDDDNYQDLAKYDTLKECKDHITNIVDSRN